MAIDRERLKFILLLLLGGIVGFSLSSVINHYKSETLDVDCLIDKAEMTNLEDLSIGYLHNNMSVGYIRGLYEQKYPRSRQLAYSGINIFIRGCER